MKRKVLQFKQGSLEVLDQEINTKDKNKKKEEERKQLMQALSLVTELGVSISLPIVGGVIAGVYLDGKFGSAPKLTLILVFLGLFLAGVQLIRVIQKN